MNTKLSFPCIIVERPHQRTGRAWISRADYELTSLLAGNKYGDNWDTSLFATRSDVIEVYGDDVADWPEELREVSEADYPIRFHLSPFGDWAGPESEADEVAFALEYIGHDLHGMNVLESQEEAEALLAAGGHNLPFGDIKDAMVELDWAEEEEEEEDETDCD